MQTIIIQTLNARMASSSFLTSIIPILADIFVFSYPVYLIYLYFFTHDHITRWKRLLHIHESNTHKHQALTIFGGFVIAVIINYIIKFFVQEPRPYKVIDLTVNPKESLILNSIPTDSMPSDHAAVAIVIALTTLLIGYRNHNTKMIQFGRLFVVFALIMDICRITIGVHRPIDIVVGTVVGTLVAYGITRPVINNRLVDRVFEPIIRFQQWLFNKTGLYK